MHHDILENSAEGWGCKSFAIGNYTATCEQKAVSSLAFLPFLS